MIASVILNTEYMSDEERIKWFLKNVSFAQNEDCVIITHERLKNKLDYLIDNCEERFYEEFEMEHIPVEEIDKMEICYIPDKIIDALYKKNSSRTSTILELINKSNKEIESIIISFIDKCLQRRPGDKLEFILNCLHTTLFLKKVSKHYSAPIIPYVFSCIRKVHGYRQTLYMAHIDDNLFISKAGEKLYESYNPKRLKYEIFSKREILALLGKKHNLPLLPLLEFDGINDFGVCGEGFHIVPNTFEECHITDDDLYFEIRRLIPNAKIVSRLHPMQMDQVGIGRKHMKNDPASFILSCKRITTVQSQMIVKAALWNRTACVLGNCLPYSFLFEKDFLSNKRITDQDLNFLIFAYFIPNDCMFNKDYWKWRLTNPSANEILEYHIELIFEELGIGKNHINDTNRIFYILKNRGCSSLEISRILGKYNIKDINYNYLTSRVRVKGKQYREVFSLNYFKDDIIISIFDIEDAKQYEILELNLTNDLDGFVTIKSFFIGNTQVKVDSNIQYWKKNEYKYVIPFKQISDNVVVRIEWSVKTYSEAF